MFYHYDQNNSGGSFQIDDDVTVNVYIEADSEEEANSKAEEVGIYFDGCDRDWDCPCCGDRWSRASNWDKAEKVPCPSEWDKMWVKEGEAHTIIYYKDGNVERQYFNG